MGQWVRIVKCYYEPRLLGSETRIHDIGSFIHSKLGIAEIELELRCERGRRYVCDRDQLEPILDDHQSCEEDFKRDLDRLLEREGVSA